MNDEQLTAEVKALEQRLTALWGWGDLGRIGWNMNGLWLDRETGNRDQVDAGHDMDAELERLLVTSYGRAIAEIDRVLPTLPQGPVLTALLERLQSRVRAIGGHSFSYYIEREPQVNEGHFENETGTRPQAEVEQAFELHQQFTRDAWHCVESSLSEYLGRVADHVAAATAGGDIANDTDTAQKGVRPRWTGTASELAFLLTELVEADHLVPPARGRKRGKEGNRAAIAEAIYMVFDIRDKDTDKPVTVDYFKSLLRPNSPDRGAPRDLFTIRPRSASK
jgi:hypothetical protein